MVLFHGINFFLLKNLIPTMSLKIAMTRSRAVEYALGIAPVFAALGPVIRWLNIANRFAYSKREVLLAT